MNKSFEQIVWIAMTRRKLAKVEQSSVALGEEDFGSKIGLSLFLTSILQKLNARDEVGIGSSNQKFL